MRMWMFNCRQISRLVSESMDRRLPLGRRLGVRFHLLMCRHCARYKQQLQLMRRLLGGHSSSDAQFPPVTMDEQAKQRLRQVIGKSNPPDDRS